MAVRTVRRRLGFEGLEQRETPSSMGGGITELAKHPKAVAFKGAGNAVYSSQTTAAVTGRANVLGNFNGEFTATSATTTSVVLDSGNNQLDLTVTGSYSKGKTPHFRGTFVIDSGTNQFAGVTGSGKVAGTLNTMTDTLKFSINGKITP